MSPSCARLSSALPRSRPAQAVEIVSIAHPAPHPNENRFQRSAYFRDERFELFIRKSFELLLGHGDALIHLGKDRSHQLGFRDVRHGEKLGKAENAAAKQI